MKMLNLIKNAMTTNAELKIGDHVIFVDNADYFNWHYGRVGIIADKDKKFNKFIIRWFVDPPFSGDWESYRLRKIELTEEDLILISLANL